jgi:hypothetical protein
MVNNKATLKSDSTAPTILLSISSNNHQSFVSVQYVLSALLYKYAESLLLICLQRNGNSLLRAGSKLIGLRLEPVKAALPLLGSGMTLASLQA